MTKPISAAFLAVMAAAAQTSVVTYHNDNARTGRYLNELLLAPANVKPGLFGKRFSLSTDGTVYAQPLYLSRVKIAGKGFHNVVFAASAHDSLYAFDADDNSGSNAQPLWQASFIDPAHGVTTVPADDVHCQVIWPELGIVGTPVIDGTAGTIYLIAETKEPGPAYVYRLHAIDVTNGAERPGSPVEIQPEGFVPSSQKQRGALLLANGMVYSPWSAHCDLGSYHGWVLAHDAATMKPAAVYNDTPGGNGASFWNGGAGPAADADGSVYVVAANGDFDAGSGGTNYGNSVVKLAPQLAVTDFFAPFNINYLNLNDLDLGSTGALLVPDEAGNSGHPHLLFAGGKEGRLYLLDRDHLGGAQTGSDSGALASLAVLSHSVFGMPAYFNGSVYVGAEYSPLRAFPVSNAALGSSPAATAANNLGTLGATPSISASGNANGIVWTVSSDNSGTLRAYDAAGLALLFDSSQQAVDILASVAEFSVPTIAGGKVYVGTAYGVEVYGELAPESPAVAAVTNAASYRVDRISPGTLVSLFGSALALTTASAQALPLPISMADVSVTVNGVAAPLLYVSPEQINAQVPFEIAPGAATVVVRTGGKSSEPAAISVQAAAPGVFADGTGQAAALNADGSRNQPGHPAQVGSFVSVFFTGQGPLNAAVEDGAAAPGGTVVSTTLKASATIGGVAAEVQFAGLAPGYAGLAQINLKVPALGSGVYPVVVSIGGVSSDPVQLAVSTL